MVELVAKRYGSAIFQLAEEKDAVNDLQKDILLIQESFIDKDLIEFLSHPKVALADKIKMLEDTLSERVGQDLLGLLVLIIRKNRQQYISEILKEVLEMIDTYQGKVKVYIESVDVLSNEKKKQIIDQLEKSTDKKIIPEYRIDKTLIGGLFIRVGDRVIDNSIKGHMHTMSKKLLETKINFS